jgi:hypothetical protein
MTMHNPAHRVRFFANTSRRSRSSSRPGVFGWRDLHFRGYSMALRLADAFGTEPGMWLDLQQQYDLWHAAKRKRPRVEKFSKAAW